MSKEQPHKVGTSSAFPQLRGLPKPESPLLSVLRLEAIKHSPAAPSPPLPNDCSSRARKRNFHGQRPYGQQVSDFDEGLLVFMAPGQRPRQPIQDRLIAKAKEILSATELSVSEIAYVLGFGPSQSFSKLFKTKTALSPLAFRHSFN